MYENTNNARRKRSVFKKKIRIRVGQLEFIRETKVGKAKTLAGKLDSIINFYKKAKQDETLRQMLREPVEV